MRTKLGGLLFTARLFFLSILLQGNIFIDSSVKVGELFGLLKFKTSFNILSRDVLLPSLTRKFLLHRDGTNETSRGNNCYIAM